MIKTITLYVCLFAFAFSQAQYFEVASNQDFFDASESSVRFIDAESDGDMDVILCGRASNATTHCNLYFNDGNGNFTESSSNDFIGLKDGNIALGDLDNDGDLDVVINGIDGDSVFKTYAYLNNNDGSFTQLFNTNLLETAAGDIVIGDIDNDGDGDILITGSISAQVATKLFLNQGDHTFVEDTSIVFPNLVYSKVMFKDVTNDGALDLFISGESIIVPNYVSQLYVNDGTGSFSLTTNPFDPVNFSQADFGDIDNDGDLDLFLSGFNDLDGHSAKTYLNDGLGNFTVSSSNFEPLASNEAHFIDVDNDGDLDILRSGEPFFQAFIIELYLNDGLGNYILEEDSTLEGFSGDLDIADIDGDGFKDFLITGYDFEAAKHTVLYKNIAENLSVSDVSIADVSVYPNPSKGLFHLNVNEHFINSTLEVYDILGKSIKRETIRAIETTLDLRSFNKGVYVLKVNSTQNSNEIFKLILD